MVSSEKKETFVLDLHPFVFLDTAVYHVLAEMIGKNGA